MSKGSRNEKQLLDHYDNAGWLPYKPATVRYGENDMWGLFDVLAVKPAEGRVHAVQVKSNAPRGIASWRIATLPWRYLGWRTLYAVSVDGEGWRVYDAGKQPADGRRACRLVLDEPGDERVSGSRGGEYNTGERLEKWLRDGD